jgi:hypothetical protein
VSFLKRFVAGTVAFTVALVAALTITLASADVVRLSFTEVIFGDGVRVGVIKSTGTNVSIQATSNSALSFGTNALERWSITTAGVLQQDASNGSSLIMQRNGSYLRQSFVQTAAAGSTISDCTALSRVYNRISTAAAGTGVCLGDVDGMVFYVQNMGANDMRLYPMAAQRLTALRQERTSRSQQRRTRSRSAIRRMLATGPAPS